MRVYHFLSEEYALQDLRRQQLKIATFADVNDPFELLPICAGRDERMRFELARAEMAALIGLLCFSRYWNSPVQWAHYADAHRGICLGFDVPDEALTRVKYRRGRSKANWAAMSSTQTVREAELKRWFTTKFVHWEYEAEERAFLMLRDFAPEGGIHFVPFSDELRLAEVIVGHRSRKTRADLNEIIDDGSGQVDVFKARLAFHSYRVVRQKMMSMWS